MTPFNDANNKSKLKKEQRIFGEQSIRLVNAILNRMFGLKPTSAYGRVVCITSLLILAGFAISLVPCPLNEWLNYLQRFFLYLFTSNNKLAIIDFVLDLIKLGIRSFFNSYVLWYTPAFFLTMFIAYQAASLYLADIFEIDHIRLARKFVRQIALTSSRDVIHVTKGKIALEDQDSPIYRIGGPGKVVVNLDSVALFEKADGHPNVIGPTENEKKGKAVLEGFERFRQALDLRDQYIDLRDDDGKYSAVKSHSLDGIPVTATDVRLMFSVYRGGQKRTPETPYPYTKEAVEQQVYKSTSKVTPYLAHSSEFAFNFENSMLSMVRGELGRFMGQRNLTEYLASISMREVKRAQEQETIILDEARFFLEPSEAVDALKEDQHLPRFIPRQEITNLFSQFAEKFTKDAKDKGVELHWIGVGTWIVPVEPVSENHLEAWKMSRENLRLDREEELNKIKEMAKTQKILSMIQNVPLVVYQERISSIADRNTAFKALLMEYEKQLNDNFESLCNSNNTKRIAPTLVAAIFFIRRRFAHFISPPPPAPASQREHELYEVLLKKIGFFEVIERLIALQRESNPTASREELLEKINKDWDLDIAGKWRPSSLNT